MLCSTSPLDLHKSQQRGARSAFKESSARREQSGGNDIIRSPLLATVQIAQTSTSPLLDAVRVEGCKSRCYNLKEGIANALRYDMKIFFAAPFTGLIAKECGFSPRHRKVFEAVIDFLSSSGHEVYSAHTREDWGNRLLKPDQLVPDDFNGLRKSDLVIAYLAEPVSQGVLIELGWASANLKPIILITSAAGQYSPMINGLHAITEVKRLMIDTEEPDKLIAFLRSAI